MSYTITITGKVIESEPTAEETAETAIAAAVTQLVAGLDGVTTASGTFDYIGEQDFLPKPTPSAAIQTAIATLDEFLATLDKTDPSVERALAAVSALDDAVTELEAADTPPTATSTAQPLGAHVEDPSAPPPPAEAPEATLAATAPAAL